MNNLTQYLGILGNILLVVSYLPQIKKTIETQKSEDISTLMWFIILAGDLLMLIYAILQKDTIFVMLFTVFVVENLVMLYLTIKFKPKKEIISPRLNMEKPTEAEIKDETIAQPSIEPDQKLDDTKKEAETKSSDNEQK